MKICQKCGAEIPNSLVIEGKRRILNRRKYCLKCSPWGYHNTKQLHIHTLKGLVLEKLCQNCGKTKLVNEFYRRRKGRDLSPYCKPCMVFQALKRQRKFKRQCVDYKGGKCQICNYDKFLGALEFHHTNPEQKDFSISQSKLWKFDEKIKKELDKCVMLCSNCHKEEHGKWDDNWNMSISSINDLVHPVGIEPTLSD